jgi:hypothetical protein
MSSSANQFSEAPKSSQINPPESSQGSSTPQEASPASEATANSSRVHPIPPPSEPMQYRAIGLIGGNYQPSEEQMTQGTLVTTTGDKIDAVLLGRVISLIKNHLDLESPHLWVVYPRTKKESDDLHVQIMGVWEPETLEPDFPPSESESPEELPEVKDGYFSIRGAVVFYSAEDEKVVVKITQSPRRNNEKPKSFKLELKGSLPGKGVGHFWEFQVQLQGKELVIQNAKDIGELPPSQRKPRKGGKPYGKSRRPSKPGSIRPVAKGAKTTESKGKPVIRKNKPEKT